jgi:ribA/ribD-fused uncharacterized protein
MESNIIKLNEPELRTILVDKYSPKVEKMISQVNSVFDAVYFSSETGDNGFLSNYFGIKQDKSFKLKIGDRSWPTVEHYFQAQKFYLQSNTAAMEYYNLIANATTPNIAKILANQKIGGGYQWRTNLNPIIQYYKSIVHIRADWIQARDNVMETALVAKFSQNPSYKTRLLATGNRKIVEISKSDTYWAQRPDGTGENKLGKILMDIRTQLRKS